MAKKKIEPKDDEIEIEDEIEDEDEDEEIETDDEPEPKPKVKVNLFPKPKDMPQSEPPPKPKVKQSETDKIAQKVDELTEFITEQFAPKNPEPKKSEYRLFDEFDITLGRDAET